jgi:hypothetical protein
LRKIWCEQLNIIDFQQHREIPLGRCLENGIGIKKDLVQAVEYYRLSAEQRNSNGQYNFGRCLEFGIEKDLVRVVQRHPTGPGMIMVLDGPLRPGFAVS